MEKRKVPEVVSLVALGASKIDFLNETMTTGNKRGVSDEVWVINKLGVIVEHDMLFRMDDLKSSYDCNNKQYTGGSVKPGTTIHDTYDTFLRNHNKPIVTSKAYSEYPTSLEYPLESIINLIGYSYFRTTPAYAVAFALYIGVKQLRIYGCDYVYPTDKYRAESGRANMEFIMGIAMTMGLEIYVSPKSTLMDANINQIEKMYGYKDPIDVKPDPDNPKIWKITPRPEVGKKFREDIILKEKGQLQALITKYRDDVKHDFIEGKWITKDDIDNHFKLLDAPERAVQEPLKGDSNDKSAKIPKRRNKRK